MDNGQLTIDKRHWIMDNGHSTWTLDIGPMDQWNIEPMDQWTNGTREQWNGLQLQLLELLSAFGLETADLYLFREDDHKY